MAWPAWDFCPVVQQLARLFSFWHAWHVCNLLAACKPRATREIQSRVTRESSRESLYPCIILSISSLSHSLPLHDSHLNTRLLIAKIQVNLAQNKANKMVDKIQPYIDFQVFRVFEIFGFTLNLLISAMGLYGRTRKLMGFWHRSLGKKGFCPWVFFHH